MIRLSATTQKLQAVLGGAVSTTQPQAIVNYSDKTSTTYNGGSQLTALNSTTDVDICAAPSSGTVRDIDYISIYNRDSASVTVTVKYDVSGTDSIILTVTLATLETLVYTHARGWECLTSDGKLKVQVGTGFTPGGSTGDVQYNNGSGGVSAESAFNYNAATNILTLLGNQHIGTNDPMTIHGSSVTGQLEINDDTRVIQELHTHSSTAANGSVLYAARSDGTTASPTIVASGDTLFTIAALGYDGVDYERAARIDFFVDATPGSNDMPGRIEFATTPDGNFTPVLALKIDNAQTVAPQKLLDISASTAGQIKFPASPNASSNVNTLDAYEEGTWTPLVGGTATYTGNNAGRYTRVGNKVFCEGRLGISTIGTGSQTDISGLPFTTIGADPLGAALVNVWDTLSLSVVFLSGFMGASGTSISLRSATAATVSLSANNVIGNSTAVFFGAQYTT